MNNEEIGQLLRETRLNKGLKINNAAKALKVRKEYLRAIESGDTSALTNEVYLAGYIKSYAKWLGLRSDQVKLTKSKKAAKSSYAEMFIKPISLTYFNEESMRPGAKIILISILATVIIYASWYNSEYSAAPVAIKLNLPQVRAALNDKPDFQKPEAPQKLVLMASDDVSVQISKANGEVINHEMKAGDVYFVTLDKGISLTSPTPEKLEVFSDDASGKFLGTLGKLVAGR